jgi:hypothetical protein
MQTVLAHGARLAAGACAGALWHARAVRSAYQTAGVLRRRGAIFSEVVSAIIYSNTNEETSRAFGRACHVRTPAEYRFLHVDTQAKRRA